MATEEVEGVLRRVDWAKGTIVILSHGVREHVFSFDLNPRTPDYRAWVGRDVRCVVENGEVTSLTVI